jgi:hypothetical protein
MSSATLTDTDRGRRRGADRSRAAVPPSPAPAESSGLRPWHFFLLATLSLATVSVVLMRHAPPAAIVFVALTVCAAGYAGYAMYRTLAPLAGAELDDDAVMVGGRTRAALERDKGLTLRAIKELEFDHAMGKVADGDFAEIRDRLRARALRLMRQLEGAVAYREAIERDVAARLPAAAAPQGAPAAVASAEAVEPFEPGAGAPIAAFFCTQCGAKAEPDARFCRMCGRPLHASA